VLRDLRVRTTGFDLEVIFEGSRILPGYDSSKDPEAVRKSESKDYRKLKPPKLVSEWR
jgi:hypothetical protein